MVLTIRPRCSGDLGIDQFAPVCFQPRKGPFLISTHKPAVTRDIRGENDSQLAFDAFCGQSDLPPHGPNGLSALSAFYALGPRLPLSFGERPASVGARLAIVYFHL